jgi:hypothetical protein
MILATPILAAAIACIGLVMYFKWSLQKSYSSNGPLLPRLVIAHWRGISLGWIDSGGMHRDVGLKYQLDYFDPDELLQPISTLYCTIELLPHFNRYHELEKDN